MDSGNPRPTIAVRNGGARMEKALVIGSSGGIGAALVQALQGKGIDVTGLSRSADGLDVTDESSVVQTLSALHPSYTTIIVATGALQIDGARPEKSLKALDTVNLSAQFALNAIGPALILKHALRLMPRDRPARFAALSARVGSIGDNVLGGWYSYRASKAALNQLIHTAAVEIARTHPCAVLALLHPGTVATRFTADYQSTHPTVSAVRAAQNLLAVLGTLTPAQSGRFYDWSGASVPW